METESNTNILKVVAELLIVFAGAVGVIGMFQDYYWLNKPNIITNEKIIIKYFAGLLVAILHSISILQRNKPKTRDLPSNRE